MKALAWSLVLLVLVCLVFVHRSQAQGALTLPLLRIQMTNIERQWRCNTTEVLRVRLPSKSAVSASSADYSLNFNDGYRYHELKPSESTQKTTARLVEVPMETVLHEFDGRNCLTIFPRKLVEKRNGYQPPPRPAHPFTPLLNELGFEGSMSDFLEGNVSSTDSRLLDVSLDVHEIEQGRASVERKTKIRKGETWQVQRIIVDTQSLIPVAGHAFTINDVTGVRQRPIEIAVRLRGMDETRFDYEMLVDRSSEGNLQDERSFVRVHIRQVPPETSVATYRVRELAENPSIQTYSQSVLISTVSHIARPPKAKKSVPPFENWLFMNNLVLGAIASYFAIKVSTARFRRQRPSFSTKVSE